MAISVTTTGSGAFADGTTTENLVDVSIGIDASPLLLGDYSSGATDISITARADTSGSVSNTQVMLDNMLTVTDTDMGTISGKVKGISIDRSGVATINARTITDYLNVDVEKSAAFGYYGPMQAGVASATGDGSVVTYTASSFGNVWSVGDMISITGFTSTQYNLTNVIVTSKAGLNFTVNSTATGTSSGTGTAIRLDFPISANSAYGTRFKLKNAIDYYFYEINKAYGTQVDYSGLTSNPNVNIPSWTGNMLQRIKEMCAIYRMRFWSSGNTYYFADITETTIDASKYPVSLNVNSNVIGRSISLTNYNSSMVTSGNGNTQYFMYYVPDVIEFDSGVSPFTIEIETPNVNILPFGGAGATFSVNIKDSSDAFDYLQSSGTTPTSSFFSVLDADDNPIPSSVFRTVTGTNAATATADGTGKITLTIIPPNNAGFSNLFKGPYKLGVQDLYGNIVSSLFIFAGGLKMNPSQTVVELGNLSSEATAVEFDTPFCYDTQTNANASYYASAYYGRGDISTSFSMPATTQNMNTVDNIRFAYNYNKYKVSNASISYPEMSVNAEPAATIADLDAIWTTKTIANLDTKITGFTVGDWSAIPLVN